MLARSLGFLARLSGSSKQTCRPRLFVSSDSTSQASSGNSEQESNTKSASSEENLRERILESALDFVCDLGWSRSALSEAAKKEGLSGIAHGLFDRGGVDILFYFEKKCNSKMMEELYPQSPLNLSHLEDKTSVSSFMQMAIELRLLMNEPYIKRWPEALALKALPQHMPDALTHLAHLVDDMWYLAGDTSMDFSWYTRRASLAVLYGTSELYMVQDDSLDFKNTRAFVEKGLRELSMLSKAKQSVDSTVKVSSGVVNVLSETAKNMAGLGWRWRR